jgi:hypothetical protein
MTLSMVGEVVVINPFFSWNYYSLDFETYRTEEKGTECKELGD